MTPRDVVNRFYEVTEQRKAEGLADLVSPDIRFEGPLMRASGAKDYLAMNQQFLPFHRGTRMLRQFELGDEVCSIYEMTLATPSGSKLAVDIVDWIEVKGGRIARQRIFYDPREFARAFGLPG